MKNLSTIFCASFFLVNLALLGSAQAAEKKPVSQAVQSKNISGIKIQGSSEKSSGKSDNGFTKVDGLELLKMYDPNAECCNNGTRTHPW